MCIAVGEEGYKAGGIEEVGRHRLGSGAQGINAEARAEDGEGGIGRAVSR
jgi:hypothetical protein